MELLFNPKKLQKAIDKLPAPAQKEAQVYYDRLLELCRSVGFKL